MSVYVLGFSGHEARGGLSSSTRDRTLAPRIGWRGPHLRTASACLLSHSSHVPLFVALWTAARQAPLSVGSSRQEYWSGLPCPPLGDLPDPDIKPMSLTSPALAGRFFTASATWGCTELIKAYMWKSRRQEPSPPSSPGSQEQLNG